MKRITVLGLGAMGRRMAGRLVAAGYDVTVWSRAGLPSDLTDLRAHVARTPREAASSADAVIATVTDDDASRSVWTSPGDGALAGLCAGALAIESSTLSPGWVTSLAAKVTSAGGRFLDAPVVGSRPQAEAGALVYLVGGDAADVERARPVLGALGAAVHHLGPSPTGALAKLAVNALFGVQVALVGELLALGRRSNLADATLFDAMASLPVMSPAAKAAGQAMLAGKFDPMFPIALVAKDFRYAVAAAEAAGAYVPLTACARDLFDAASGGLGGENITAIAKAFDRTLPNQG